jgi:acyl-CoA reductase-like NAD-dependent aldehyde dehydrogenase
MTQAADALHEDVRKMLDGSPRKLLIGGEWVASQGGETIITINPATGERLAEVYEAREADVDAAVKAARAAFDGGAWREMSAGQRGEALWRLGDLIDAHSEELSQIDTLDNGKPIRESRWGDVPLSGDHFRYFAGWTTKIQGETIPVSLPFASKARFFNYTLPEPVGVVGAITPWNFPLLMAAWKLAPALAAGCTVVLKPAEQTPLSALRLGELIAEAGLPEGVVNIVPGYGPTAGAALVNHPDVDKIAFTGSTAVGREIVRASAGNLKKLSLELGGKSPQVVFADADLNAAARGAFMGFAYNQGQICTAGSRLFVEASVADEFVERLQQFIGKTTIGPGLDSETRMGPLVSQEQLDRVLGYIESGKDDGAELVAGGERIEGDLAAGYFVQPTIFTGVTDEMAIANEEIFGPVLSVMTFENEEELVERANRTIYGLVAGVWTQDVKKAHRTAALIKAGTVYVNCFNVFSAGTPFGGTKQSGYGREFGSEGLRQYLQTKSVWLDMN